MSNETTTRWALPQEVDDVTIAFPARVEHLMPSYGECGAALAEMSDRGARWLAFQMSWFADGLPERLSIRPREGVDPDAAFRHLYAIQASYQPKHEHKAVAVAYLASLWFEEPPAPAEEADRAR